MLKLLNYFIRGYQYQAFLAYLEASFLNFAVSGFLQLINSSCHTPITYFSLILAYTGLTLVISYPGFVYYISHKYVKKTENPDQLKEKFGVIYEPF